MSHWSSDWSRLRDRLRAFDQALRTTAENLRDANEHYGDVLHLARREANAVVGDLTDFHASHGGALPVRAGESLAELIKLRAVLVDCSSTSALTSISSVLAFKLASIEYYLSDADTRSRSLVERAFLHLDRLIVVDPDVRRRWTDALAKGEVACEREGGVHLLHHGIWAFKAHGAGERTDLILGTPITEADIESAAKAAETMVLTEWKCIAGPAQLSSKYDEARRQLTQYGRGVLAGLELRSTRYAVTVGLERVQRLPAVTEDSWTCEHIHIAVAPSAPSKLPPPRRGSGGRARRI